MIGINSVCLEGGLPRNAEFKMAQNGLQILSFSFGWNTYQKGINERNEKANYIDVTLFGKQAEALKNYLVKGTKVSVQGKLNMESWQDTQTQQTRTKITIIADHVSLLSGGNGTGNNQQQNQQFQQQVPQQQFQQPQQNFAQQPQFVQNPQYQQTNQTLDNFSEDCPF